MDHVSVVIFQASLDLFTGWLSQGSSEQQDRASPNIMHFSLLALYLLIFHWPKQGTWPVQTGVWGGELDSTSQCEGEIVWPLFAICLSNFCSALLFAIFALFFFLSILKEILVL